MSGREAVAAASTAGAILTIDLDALAANWRALARRAAPAHCAAVVKADAYGTGIEQAVPALAAAGCNTFFVALPDEALRVRAVCPDAAVYCLDGLFNGLAPHLATQRIRPVLGSLQEVEEWAAFCRSAGQRLPAAIHIDTGMNRLGLSLEEAGALSGRADLLSAFEPALVMSHLACADTPEHPLNARQRERFAHVRRLFPGIPGSLANSAGTLLGGDHLHDLCRPGVALYGGRALMDRPNPMQPVVRLEARILQVREVAAGETVGYGAAETARRPSRVAILALGYADGILRRAGSSDRVPGARVRIGGHEVPLIGRISMDLTAVDVTDVPPDLVQRGASASVLDDRLTVDDLAEHAGTIGYEILTALGQRYERRYVGGQC